MKIPSHLKNMSGEYLFQEGGVFLQSGLINKLFNQSDELKRRMNEERLFEIFGVDKLGPRDLMEPLNEFTRKNIEKTIAEFDSGMINEFEDSYAFIEGSMNEVSEAMQQMGIDLPEGLDLIPWISEIVLGIRLLLDVKAVNNDFEGISKNVKTNIAAAKVLVLISKFGVTTTLSMVGGLAGGATGASFAGIGAVVGAPIGTLTGAVAAGQLNKKIAPHSQDLAYKLLKLEKEDLVYYKNKIKIDEIGFKLLETRKQLEII
ncbi:hypothetical protein KQ939_09955 [Planococcus sp. CP5-4]|uniref:hypothetical protein n=1 Tax=unclassified Planococcus (in: firmicutes) TaxID=2662419 RepID=UPI001C2300E0|nr:MULTISPECIES: hypothetical protein [unclassified Planococcus (in: firmicutes)]MBU9673861.1 hypothetical protein [Planococcus sp. CP5-4_YE]MBV0908989.1 hypothetical protein [Planococcus sp. CP5-4_UN]MBW6064038.1 hypothetical protein [Planococcus sp. CP5-4]